MKSFSYEPLEVRRTYILKASGKLRPVIKTFKNKMKQKKENARKWLKENMPENIVLVLEKLKLKLQGHYNYYYINVHYHDLCEFYKFIKYAYYKVLIKRGQKHSIPKERYNIYWYFMKMPEPQICVNIW